MTEETASISDAQLKVARISLNVNALEGILNRYIAEYYTRNKNNYEETYFSYLSDILQTNRITLKSKVDIIFLIFNKLDNKERIKSILSKTDSDKWLKYRNAAAHGELMAYNGKDRLFYNGKIYNIESMYRDFLAYNRKILSALNMYPELEGPYFSMTRATKGVDV